MEGSVLPLKKGDMHGWGSRSLLVSSVGLNICVCTGVNRYCLIRVLGYYRKLSLISCVLKTYLFFRVGGAVLGWWLFPDSCRLVACILCLYHWKSTLVHKPRVYLESNFLVLHHLNKYLWLTRMCCLGHSMWNYDDFLYQSGIDPDHFVSWLP